MILDLNIFSFIIKYYFVELVPQLLNSLFEYLLFNLNRIWDSLECIGFGFTEFFLFVVHGVSMYWFAFEVNG